MFYFILNTKALHSVLSMPRTDGAEQYAGDLECVFYGYHLDRAILKNAEAAYCLMPSILEHHRFQLPYRRQLFVQSC